MVVPSDLYCNLKGYTLSYDNEGVITVLPDYKRALQIDVELNTAITTIGQMMADRGFPLKLLEQELKSIQQEKTEDAMMMSNNGSEIEESPVDWLKRVSKSDIIMQVTWSVNKSGPRYSLTFSLQGIDAYTNKQIAACQGTGEPTFSAELPVLLEESIVNNLDVFNSQLQNYFDDMFINGREVSLKLKRWNDTEYDFESKIGNTELCDIIEDWVADNTVNGRFNLTDATENMMSFEQVRIPVYDENGRAVDTRRWARELTKYLSSLNIPTKLIIKGLGQATIIIGGK